MRILHRCVLCLVFKSFVFALYIVIVCYWVHLPLFQNEPLKNAAWLTPWIGIKVIS